MEKLKKQTASRVTVVSTRNVKYRIRVVLTALVIAMIFAGCSTSQDDGTITVTGTVRSVGNVPVNQYVLNSEDTQYMIDKKYCKYVGSGEITVIGYITGNGMYGKVFDIIEVIK